MFSQYSEERYKIERQEPDNAETSVFSFWFAWSTLSLLYFLIVGTPIVIIIGNGNFNPITFGMIALVALVYIGIVYLFIYNCVLCRKYNKLPYEAMICYTDNVIEMKFREESVYVKHEDIIGVKYERLWLPLVYTYNRHPGECGYHEGHTPIIRKSHKGIIILKTKEKTYYVGIVDQVVSKVEHLKKHILKIN